MNKKLKIGVLLPRSDMFPALGGDFLNGLKLILNSLDRSVSIQYIIESIGNATGDKFIRTAEKMILQESPDLTLSFCGIFRLAELTTIFNSYRKPLIHLDLGGNVLKKEHKSPYVLHHSLNLCEAAFRAGQYAAQQYGKKGALTASFYDGGYQLAHSFVKGFTEKGGEIVYNYVGPMDYKSETFEAMIQGLEANQPNVVFTLFSYKEGAKVCKILAGSSLSGKIPFVSIPLMTDEYFNRENYGLEKMISVASWSFDEASPEMQGFLKAYKAQYSEAPNIMGLLGYEAGILVKNCMENHNGIPSKIAELLVKETINTPRGLLAFTSLYESYVPQLKVRKFQFNQTKYHNRIIDYLESPTPEQLNQDMEELPYSGWQNPYICT